MAVEYKDDDPYRDDFNTPYGGGASDVPPGFYRDPKTGQLIPIDSVQGQTPSGPAGQPPGGFAWAPGATQPTGNPPGFHWDANMANWAADTPNNGGSGGGGGGGGGPAGSLSSIFQAPAERFNEGAWAAGQPTFRAPAWKQAPAFVEPDYAAALQDPGYQFEASEGRRAMEQGAAAKGVLNGGGTLKDVNAWGQNFATTRVNDVRNRARDAYTLNYKTQYDDPYKYAYQGALDAFTGGLAGWQTQGQMGQRQNETDWLHAYTPFNDLWNRQIQVGLAQ